MAKMNNPTPTTCPTCTHGKGFKCVQCWPKGDRAGMGEGRILVVQPKNVRGTELGKRLARYFKP